MKVEKVFSKQKECVVHLALWTLACVYVLFNFKIDQRLHIKLVIPSLFQITFYITFIITFYFQYLVTLSVPLRRNFSWSKFLVKTVLAIVLFIGLRAFIEQFLAVKFFGVGNYYDGTPVFKYIIENSLLALFPILIASMLWLVIRYIRVLQLNQFYFIENQLAEMKFLKSQINPHAIFNTLNNIYAMVYMQSPAALAAIEKLGNIIRFTTYEVPKEWIPIGIELTYIENLIALEKLRYKSNFYVDLQLDIGDEQYFIQPFILIPLVENALKHGVLTDENHPIHIFIKQESTTVSISVSNKKRIGHKDAQGGVGLENLTKRLSIKYKDKYNFVKQEDVDSFSVNLILYGK